MDLLGNLITAAVLLLPAVGAWLLSRKAYRALKKKQSKWAVAAGISSFIGCYLATMMVIVVALFFLVPFRR